MLAFVDVESTGLDARIHQPYEVCVWRADHESPTTFDIPHTLEFADAAALVIGQYFERGFRPWDEPLPMVTPGRLIGLLQGVTLVGSNPDFDDRMLTRVVGAQVWNHRRINVATMAMTIFDWDEPRGLADVTGALQDWGHAIPSPDHTAEGDVRTARAVYDALRAERKKLRWERE